MAPELLNSDPGSAADLVNHVSDLQDARPLHLVQLPEQRRRLVDVFLGRFALTIAVIEEIRQEERSVEACCHYP